MRMNTLVIVTVVASALLGVCSPLAQAREQWTSEQANQWYQSKPWLVGCNFSPSTAINQLEMWQADTFDPATIERELGWAEGLGFNSIRVFLHHLPYEQDTQGFLGRIDKFLEIADRHHIGVMFVLFDSVWDPHPTLGKQRGPKPGLHNSGWVQSPGVDDLRNPARQPVLEAYVKGVIGRFKDDRRVHVWDLYNEPDNTNGNSYGAQGTKEEPADKVALSLALLKKTFAWARAADPSQPLTSGVWQGDWSGQGLSETARVQLESSDVVSFHTYDPLPEVKQRVESVRHYNRPLLCTEYMARPRGSTFAAVLPWFKEQRIAAYNWGFVAGKTNTIYPWDSWQKPYASEPKVWFHDIFRPDGTPFDTKEVELIRQLTGKGDR
jgi:hypothetical protein